MRRHSPNAPLPAVYVWCMSVGVVRCERSCETSLLMLHRRFRDGPPVSDERGGGSLDWAPSGATNNTWALVIAASLASAR